MKKEINRLMREAKKEGTRVHLPQNVIYLNYVRDRRSYLDKIALYPFDSIPKPVFRKRPNGY
jgi:hypothetical protein